MIEDHLLQGNGHGQRCRRWEAIDCFRADQPNERTLLMISSTSSGDALKNFLHQFGIWSFGNFRAIWARLWRTLSLLSPLSQKMELKIFWDRWANAIASWVLPEPPSRLRRTPSGESHELAWEEGFPQGHTFPGRELRIWVHAVSLSKWMTLCMVQCLFRELNKAKVIRQTLTHILVLRIYFHKASFVSSHFPKPHNELWRPWSCSSVLHLRAQYS